MASKFNIFRAKNQQYYFHLEAGNGEIVLSSEGYISKSSCKNGIDSVKENSTNDERYERKDSGNNKHYFILKAGDGEIIGASEMYETTAGRDKGIEIVKREAPGAETEDQAD